ncbi:transcription factor GAMYB-like isoform X1 [Olea europaea subsp. europaea]|uniref:Transcription factor GAMYB-like isoform X1 n=1 Tax=Olea europaea subsp. europaea TaxID=158383 RepID=A0A8S0SD72_OLEEU|nr:transcription factor GAMYB-like isoform X1 [Olea europaea subsp. europaea]
MSSESEEKIISKDSVDSTYIEEDTSEGNVSGNDPLKKGPWTSAQDAILIEYVTKHGEGNWNAVRKHSGLARCGKSCCLRWMNHLRPDLNKGAYTPEEKLSHPTHKAMIGHSRLLLVALGMRQASERFAPI